MSKVAEELLKVTKVKKKKGEDHQELADRIVKAIDKLEDDDWSDLSEDAQKWANDAAKKAKAKKPFPDFPDDEDEEGEEEEEEEKSSKKPAKKEEKKPAKKEDKKSSKKKDEEEEGEDEDEDGEEEEEDEKPAKKGAKEDKKKSSDKKEEKASKPRGSGVTASIKKIMIEDPNISVEDLTKALKKAGFDTISNMTVTTVRADFRHTLKILHEEKGLSKDLASKMSE